ncbi:MAG TPA: phosphatase PAP2 family protein [Acidothermaceae bacterium]|jgi:membrane-associated phospholipid phosphatase|nr:phosphatase PAP2 family protein [Acidothermaceae bacterium]
MRRTFAFVFSGAALLLVAMIALGLLDVHVLAHSRFGRVDGSVDSTLAHHRDHVLNALTLGATDAASTLPIIAVGVLVIISAALAFRRWREPLFVLTVVVGEVAIFVVTTLVVHRPRPNVVRLDHAPPTSSFPSGHTAASVALYGSIAALVVCYGARMVWRRLAITVAILFPIVVAASRLYRGMHYPTDVVGGALLGFTWLRMSMYAILGTPKTSAQTQPAASTAHQPDAAHQPQLAPQSAG